MAVEVVAMEAAAMAVAVEGNKHNHLQTSHINLFSIKAVAMAADAAVVAMAVAVEAAAVDMAETVAMEADVEAVAAMVVDR